MDERKGPPGFEVDLFDRKGLTDRRIETLVDLEKLYRGEMRPDDPMPSDEALAASLRSWAAPTTEMRMALSWLGGRGVGFGRYNVDLEDNPHLVWIDAYVLPDARRRGIGGAMAHALLYAAMRADRTSATFRVRNDAAVGAEIQAKIRDEWALAPRMVERTARLELAGVDRVALRRRLDERLARFQGEIGFLFFENDTVPGPETGFRLHEFLGMVQEIENLMPREGLEIEDERYTEERFFDQVERQRQQRRVIWNVIALHLHTGRTLGITNVAFNPSDHRAITQWDTGVRGEAQGRGIATVLKDLMLERILDELPGAMLILTENAASNAAMIAINTRLGFVEHYTTSFYQVPFDRLHRLL